MASGAVTSTRLTRPCPICSQIGGKTLYQQHFVGHPYQIIKQCTCSMIYADSGLTQSDYDAMYRDKSKYAGLGGEGIPDDKRRLEHTVAWLSAFARPETSILDYGCATGDLLLEFKAAGFAPLYGYDASPACQEAIRARGVAQVAPEGQKYGAVVLSHVLEHIYDIQAEFPRIVDLVEEDGLLYIEVPDAAKYRSISPFQEFNTEHVNHFTMATLCALAGRHNLVPLHIGEKQFEVGDHIPYSAIFAIFRKMKPVGLGDYIASSQQGMREIDKHLFAALYGIEELVIWGAGQLTVKLLALASLSGRKIRLFDSNQSIQGTKIGDIMVEAPQTCDYPILVGSLLNAKSIEKSIRERGYTNRMIFLA